MAGSWSLNWAVMPNYPFPTSVIEKFLLGMLLLLSMAAFSEGSACTTKIVLSAMGSLFDRGARFLIFVV